MITLTVRQAARKSGIKTAYQLAIAMGGVVHKAKAARLWKGEGTVELETIGELASLLQCDASDLFVWRPGKRTKPSSARQGGTKKATKKRRVKAELRR